MHNINWRLNHLFWPSRENHLNSKGDPQVFWIAYITSVGVTSLVEVAEHVCLYGGGAAARELLVCHAISAVPTHTNHH